MKIAAIVIGILAILAQSPAQTKVKGFASCSTSPEGGMDTYFSDVFPVEAVTGRLGVYLHSLDNVYDAFQQYLTSKGYKFKPSGAASCDFATDESAAKAAKHRRAYEGNPCSNCGKVVETGWKYGSTAPAEAASAEPPASKAQPHPAQAQNQENQYYFCDGFYLGGHSPSNLNLRPNTHFVTGVFESSGEHAAMDQAWLNYLKTKYGGVPSGNCSAGTPQVQMERLRASLVAHWAVIDEDWKYAPGQAVTAPEQAAPAAAVAEPTRTSRAAPAPRFSAAALTGVYNGTYTCAIGPRTLKLSLAASGGGSLTGVFTFYLPPASHTQAYSFSLSGSFDAATGKFTLRPVKWETPPPPNYVMVGMDGAFNAGTQQVSGNITGLSSCSTFDAARGPAPG